jgi:hypothetical protein
VADQEFRQHRTEYTTGTIHPGSQIKSVYKTRSINSQDRFCIKPSGKVLRGAEPLIREFNLCSGNLPPPVSVCWTQ